MPICCCCSAPTFRFRNFFPATMSRKSKSTRTLSTSDGGLPLILALVGDIKATVAALLPKVSEKNDRTFLERHVAETQIVPRSSSALRRERTGNQTDTSGIPGRDA